MNRAPILLRAREQRLLDELLGRPGASRPIAGRQTAPPACCGSIVLVDPEPGPGTLPGEGLMGDAYQVYSKSGGGGAVGVVVGSTNEALAKARELAESGGGILIKDLSGKTIDPEAVAEIAARE